MSLLCVSCRKVPESGHYALTGDGCYCIGCFTEKNLKANEELWNLLQNLHPPEIKIPLARRREALIRVPSDLTPKEAEALACAVLSFKRLIEAGEEPLPAPEEGGRGG